MSEQNNENEQTLKMFKLAHNLQVRVGGKLDKVFAKHVGWMPTDRIRFDGLSCLVVWWRMPGRTLHMLKHIYP